jgi:Leucine-rich repeat (LRR) protein
MKNKHLLLIAGLLLLQAVCSGAGRAFAQTLTADTLTWTWEVTTTTSTMTKTCTMEFSGDLILNWGDGSVQTLSDTLSGDLLTHIYASAGDFVCTATGTGLTYFKADSRRLKTLDPTKATALTYLSCTSNQLTGLDVSKNPLLVSLYCGGNNLTQLSVTSCLNLQTLTCSDNKLTGLDVSALSTLKKLTCHTNALTSLSVCSSGSLSYVSCLSCSLQVAALDTLFARLPALTAVSTSKNLYVLNNPGSANCNIAAATTKNWTSDVVTTSSSFYIPTTSCIVGDSVELDIYLTNPVPVIAFELDVIFPKGFTLDTLRSCLSPSRKGGHMLSVARTGNEPLKYKFMAYSMMTGDVFLGNSGVLLKLCGTMPDSVQTVTVQLQQAVLVDTATNMSTVTVSNGTLKIESAVVKGDVNGDEQVNVTDVVNLVAYINGCGPSGFDPAAADLDGNGSWNVADITRMVVIINASEVTLRSSRAFSDWKSTLALYDNQTVVSGNNLYLRASAGSSNCLELCLDNAEAVQACQVDITLPDGLQIMTQSVSAKTPRQNGHLLQVNALGANRYRLLLFAFKPDAAFQADTGALVLLPLQIAESLPYGDYPVYLDAPVLTGMDRTTLSSKVYDCLTNIGSELDANESLKAGTDGQSGLWVQGPGLTEVTVLDLTGRKRFHLNPCPSESCSLTLPIGMYIVHARSILKPDLVVKVAVR